MYNVSKPTIDDLPTSKQLLRSTFIALVAAIAILVAIVLPPNTQSTRQELAVRSG